VAEIIVFNSALSETDRKNVEAYLAAKWGIAIPYQASVVLNQNLKVDARPFTLEGWFKVTTVGSEQGIVANWDRSVPKGWRVYATSGSKLRFEINDGAGHSQTLDSTASLSNATWYYFAARYDGTNMKLTLGGTTYTQAFSYYPPAVSTFYFGTTDDGTSSLLTGALSSVSWHKGLYLGDSELTAHYNSGSGRECCPIK
jgi:hypothetical protein